MAKKEIDFIIKVNNKELDLTKTSVEKFDAVIKNAKKDLVDIGTQFGKNSQQYKTLNVDINNAEKAWKSAQQASQQFGDENKKSGEKVMSYSQQIRQATRELVSIEQQFGKNSAQYAEQQTKIKGLRDAQEELTRGTLKLDDALSNIPGPIGQIGSSMKQLEVVTQSSKSALQSLGLGFDSFDKLLKTSLVGFIVGLLITLSAALVKAAESFEPLQDAFARIKDAVGALFDALKPITDFLLKVFVGAINLVADAINGLATVFGGVNNGFNKMSKDLERSLKLQQKLLDNFSTDLTKNLQDQIKIRQEFGTKLKEVLDAQYSDEKERQADILQIQLDAAHKLAELQEQQQTDRLKKLRELNALEADSYAKGIDNKRSAEAVSIGMDKLSKIREIQDLKSANELKKREIQQSQREIEKTNSKDKEKILDELRKSYSEIMELGVYYDDLEKKTRANNKAERLQRERAYNREDIRAINERYLAAKEAATQAIKDEADRNLALVKLEKTKLLETQRIEREDAALSGITRKGLANKQLEERKLANEKIRLAQIAFDANEIQDAIDQQTRLSIESGKGTKEYFNARYEIIKKGFEKEYLLADGDNNKQQQARTNHWAAILQLDKDKIQSEIEIMNIAFNGMADNTSKAFDQQRAIANKEYEQQQLDYQNNFEALANLKLEHEKKIRAIDQAQLEYESTYFQRRAETEKKLYGQMFMDLEFAEERHYQAEKKRAEGNAQELEIIEREHVQRLKDLQNQKIQAYAAVATATIDSLANMSNAIAAYYEFEANNTKNSLADRKKAFEENKKYQIATASLAAASGIIQILTQPSTLPSPFDWIVKVANAAALGIMTAVQISKINATKFDATSGGSGSNTYNGLGRNYGDGGMIDGPSHSSSAGGVRINAEGGEAVMTKGAVTMFAPLLSAMNQMGGGRSFTAGAKGQASFDNPKTLSSNGDGGPTIIKTYVVSTEMTSEQQKQARLKDLSTL